jgi:hypothetical protein
MMQLSLNCSPNYRFLTIVIGRLIAISFGVLAFHCQVVVIVPPFFKSRTPKSPIDVYVYIKIPS